MLSEMTHWWTS